MQENTKYDILSLNVRGIRDQLKRRRKGGWGGEIFLSHGTKHSKGVCIFIHPSIWSKIDYVFSRNSGRMVLIAMESNSLKLSLCNVYAPNSHSEQLTFLQELGIAHRQVRCC